MSLYVRPSALRSRLDLVGDQPALGLAVPDAAHLDLLAALGLGPQGLAQPALVGGDQARGGAEDVAGGAVVALQPDDLGAREVALEAQDVVHLGAAPAVDRLVVVADAADVAGAPGPAAAATGTGRRWCPGTRRPGCSGSGGGTRPARPGASAKMVRLCSSRSPKSQAFSDAQPLLVEPVERLRPCRWRSSAPSAGGSFSGVQPRFFQWSIRPASELRRPALGVDVLGLEQLLEQPLLVVGVEDGEARLQPHQLGVAAQDLGGDRVEGAEPAQALGRRADQVRRSARASRARPCW